MIFTSRDLHAYSSVCSLQVHRASGHKTCCVRNTYVVNRSSLDFNVRLLFLLDTNRKFLPFYNSASHISEGISLSIVNVVRKRYRHHLLQFFLEFPRAVGLSNDLKLALGTFEIYGQPHCSDSNVCTGSRPRLNTKHHVISSVTHAKTLTQEGVQGRTPYPIRRH